jgi:hypothetical protein
MSIRNFALANVCPALAFNLDRLIDGKLDSRSWGKPVEELAPKLQADGWLAGVGPAPIGYLWKDLPEEVQDKIGDPVDYLIKTMEGYTNLDVVQVKDGDQVVWSRKVGEAIERARALHNSNPLDVVCFSRNRTLFAAHFVERELNIDIDVQTWQGWDHVHRQQDAENIQAGRQSISRNVKLSRAKWYYKRGASEAAIRKALGLKRGEAQKIYAICEFDANFPEARLLSRVIDGPEVKDGQKVYGADKGLDYSGLDWQTLRSLSGSVEPSNASFTETARKLLREVTGQTEDGTDIVRFRTPTPDDAEKYLAMSMGAIGGKERQKVAIPHADLRELLKRNKGSKASAPVTTVLTYIVDGDNDALADLFTDAQPTAPAAEAPEQPEAPKAEAPEQPEAPAAEAPAADPTDGGGKAKKGTRSRGSRATN